MGRPYSRRHHHTIFQLGFGVFFFFRLRGSLWHEGDYGMHIGYQTQLVIYT